MIKNECENVVKPPALPPKRPRLNSRSSMVTPPASPKLKNEKEIIAQRISSDSQKSAQEFNVNPPPYPARNSQRVANPPAPPLPSSSNETCLNRTENHHDNNNNHNKNNNVNVFKTIDEKFTPNSKNVLEPAVLNTKQINSTGNDNSSKDEEVVVVLREKV